MDWVVRLFAPRSAPDFALRLVGMVLLLNAINLGLLAALLPPDRYHVRDEVMAVTLIATPFVALIFQTLRHLVRLQGQLADLAATDMLTGLTSRRAFMARLDPGWGVMADGMLLILDVDHFKRINDTWGHAAGDVALRALGDRLRGLIRAGDLAARLGGEEFALFLPGAAPGAAPDRAADLGTVIVAGLTVQGASLAQPLAFTLSVGAAAVQRGDALDAALGQADAALYRAKAEGRARIVFAAVGAPARAA